MIWNVKPDYAFLKVFGCLAYFRNTDTKGDKFEDRGKPGIFLGYPGGTKGYTILDLETKKMIVSRDVVFHEEFFPFRKAEMNDNCEREEPAIIHDCHCSPIQRQVDQNLDQNLSPTEEETDLGQPTDETEKQSGLDQNANQAEAQPDPSVVDISELDNLGRDDEPNNIHVNNDLEAVEQNISHEEPDMQNEVRPTRTRTQPSKFKDFVVQVTPSVNHPTPASNRGTSKVDYPISNFVSYDNFTTNHKAFLTAITKNDEPKNYKQATQDTRWCEAMQKEIKALEKNKTWTLEQLPKGKKARDSKWVYKIKFKPNGEVERYKARFVAKGFTQMEGVD
ncbi:putative RNA-directed DNA polymerase [Helianthus annuus]|nr:putative RNA-directed DNA polymerase [Helianthus annuus]KAJ0607864.1 putative RNA-directed DNA polymerase [Helianthus annuus]KAJ0767928.1 putative RNA-directed DNA polymerase [Helianthus annuus]